MRDGWKGSVCTSLPQPGCAWLCPESCSREHPTPRTCKRPAECQLIHSTVPISNRRVTPSCCLWALDGAGSASGSMSLSPLAGIAPASFMCCLHDWQCLVQRAGEEAMLCHAGLFPVGIDPATAQPCKVAPSAAQKHMHGGVGLWGRS